MEIKDNLNEIVSKLGKPFDGVPIQRRQVGRRIISPGLGRRRKFAGVVRGEEILKVGSLDSSGAVNLGASLPSPGEMVHREQEAELQKEFLKNKDKFPLPKKDDERFKI